jgi:hypothetical protein
LGISSLGILSFVHDSGDHPTDRTFTVADGFACRHTVGRNDDSLVHARAVRVDGDLRHTFGLARSTDRLANDEPPALQAWMLTGSDHVPFDTG